MKLTKHQIEQVCRELNENLISFSFLAKGNHNSNYFLETAKNKYVIRVEDNRQFKNLKKEFEFLKIEKSRLGPRAILFDASHKIISNDYFVEEFIDGKHPSEKHPTDDFVIQMARWLKKLHKTTKKASKPYLLRTAVKPYYKRYLKYKNNIKDKELKEKLSHNISKALKILEKNNTIFANRKIISLLHNDTSSGNVFYKSGHVRLIDWEFVNYGLPERELSYFLDSYRLTKKQERLFLKNYGYPNTKKANIQLNIAYIILLLASIGYSLWRLEILRKSKALKKDKAKRVKRLRRDINLLEEKINL